MFKEGFRCMPGFPYIVLAGLIVLVDQGTKLWVLQLNTPTHQILALLPVLNVDLIFNPGAAMSFLSEAGGWQRWFFIGVALLTVMILFVWLLRLRRDQQALGWALGLIAGGAVGNVVDRIRLGAVVDFIDLHVGPWHWPAYFNIADMAITGGALLLLWLWRSVPTNNQAADAD